VGIRGRVEMMEMGARQRMLNDRVVPPNGMLLGNPQSTLLDVDGSLWRIWHPNGFNGKYWIGSQPGQRFHDLMEEARYTLDPKKRKALYAEAIAIRNEEKPSLDLFQEMVVYGTSKRVSFKPRADYRLIVAEMALAGRWRAGQTYGRTRSPKSLIASMILSCGGPPEWAWRSRSKNVLASVAFCQRWNSRMQVSGSPRIRRSGASVSSVNSEPAGRLRNSARRFSQ
jgi:hypothetical protein